MNAGIYSFENRDAALMGVLKQGGSRCRLWPGPHLQIPDRRKSEHWELGQLRAEIPPTTAACGSRLLALSARSPFAPPLGLLCPPPAFKFLYGNFTHFFVSLFLGISHCLPSCFLTVHYFFLICRKT